MLLSERASRCQIRKPEMSMIMENRSVYQPNAYYGQAGMSVLLNNRAILYHRILRDDDDSVANVVGTVLAVSFSHFGLVHSRTPLPIRAFLSMIARLMTVPSPIPTRGLSAWQIGAHLFKRLIVVSAHQKRRLDEHPFRNPGFAIQRRNRYRRPVIMHPSLTIESRICDSSIFEGGR